MHVSNRIALLIDRLTNVDQECRRDALSLFEPSFDSELLDLGCGSGDFTLKIADKISAKLIYGIDAVPENVEQARARGINCFNINLDRSKFPFENEKFDVICATNIIEHLSDTDSFIEEIYRVLKPNGYAVISTPNLSAWHIIAYLFLGWQPRWVDISDRFFWAGRPHTEKAERTINNMPAHRRVFTQRALKDLLKYYDFQIERSIGSALYPLPAPIARFLVRFLTKRADIINVKIRKNYGKDTNFLSP